MTDRELMQQALVALGAMQSYAAAENKGLRICDEAIEALHARLDGWERVNMTDHKEGDLGIGTVKWDASAPLVVTPHPAFKKSWVGLTDEECLQNPYCAGENDAEVIQLARAIEAKLKEKNA